MLPRYSERAVERLIARAATDSERVVSLVRASFIAASFSRTVFFVWLPYGTTPAQVWISSVSALFAVAFSIWVFFSYRERTAPKSLFWVSVTLDASLCFVVLLLNPLFPGPGYPGLLFMPDVTTLGVVGLVAGFRLSKGAAAFGGVLVLGGFAALLLVDEAMGGPAIADHLHTVVLFVIVLAASSGLGVVIAARTRTLVVRGAHQALEAERAERNLGALLQDHHDVRTLLSSAALNADLVARGIEAESGEDLGGLARELRSDLDQVNDFISGIKERAYDEISALQAPVPVDVDAAVGEVFAQLERRFPNVGLDAQLNGGGARVWASGGAPTLQRVLWNLIVNACEGDGTERARSVTIAAEPGRDGETLLFRVDDDGPGFPRDVLEAPLGARTTTKEAGSGLGLVLVETLLGSNAATLERVNRAEGGASVRFALPAVR